MKATGHLRQVDYLGRIVIPKELRIALKIRYEDIVEIFLQDDFVCIRKFLPDLGSELKTVTDILKEKLSVYDSDEHKQKEISNKIEQLYAIVDYFSDFRNEMEADNDQ